MDVNATLPATTPPAAKNTLNDLIRWIRTTDLCLIKRIHEPNGPNGSTRGYTEAETALTNKLETIRHRDLWLDTLLEKFLDKYGETDISEQWYRLTDIFLMNENAIREEITSVSEHDAETAIQDSLLKCATSVAGAILGIDIIRQRPIVEVSRRPPSGSVGGKADIWVYLAEDQPIFHYEAKSTKVLQEGNVGMINEKSKPGGSWWPNFKWPTAVNETGHSKLKKMIIQVCTSFKKKREKGF